MSMKKKMGSLRGETSRRIQVRELDETRDSIGVEAVERECEVGPSGKLSLFTDLLGDPLCRVRHSPAFRMLVAELVITTTPPAGAPADDEPTTTREIVGMIRGCIKTVTCGQKLPRALKNHPPTPPLPVYTKLAYILGLRVSPSHRRMGIAMKLVRGVEEWFRDNGAEYSYLATENDNVPSIKLFTDKCGYSKFRTPSILVQPVFAHRVRITPSVAVVKLTPSEAELLYRRRFATTEFFPRDIDAVLNNKLTLGSFLAIPRSSASPWAGVESFLSSVAAAEYSGRPMSWAVGSVWNCKDLWRLEVKGASRMTKGLAKTTRLVDRALPFLRIPSMPEVFRPFGLHFVYGLGGEGPLAVKMVRALCGLAHNLAKDKGCGVVATEVASQDPLRLGVPHWKMLSCAEDLWCIKRLGEDYSDGSLGDWTKSPPAVSIFVDPREF